METVLHPCAAEPCIVAAIHCPDRSLRRQRCGVIDRMAEADGVINAFFPDRTVAVERHEMRVILRNRLQAVHPVGQVDPFARPALGFHIGPA